jgi:hypothetical protein
VVAHAWRVVLEVAEGGVQLVFLHPGEGVLARGGDDAADVAVVEVLQAGGEPFVRAVAEHELQDAGEAVEVLAGVVEVDDITVIALWLGHEQIATTNICQRGLSESGAVSCVCGGTGITCSRKRLAPVILAPCQLPGLRDRWPTAIGGRHGSADSVAASVPGTDAGPPRHRASCHCRPTEDLHARERRQEKT